MASITIRSSDRILQKALELFSQRGYDATSVREICEAAEITKPTLYHFYGSKEGVYRALVDGALEDFRRDVVRSLAESDTAQDQLRRVARVYFEYARSRRELMRFLFSLIHNPPSAAPPTDFTRFYEEVVGLVSRAAEEGVARGELTPDAPHARMLIFMGTLGEAVCGYVLTGRPEPTPELADTLVEIILKGWTPR